MGESSGPEISVYGSELESFSVETPGGRIRIRWDYEASATPNAHLAFFAESLATVEVYESWVDNCPLTYSSSNAFGKRDILGTWFSSILAGHHRYAHITGLCGDGVSLRHFSFPVHGWTAGLRSRRTAPGQKQKARDKSLHRGREVLGVLDGFAQVSGARDR